MVFHCSALFFIGFLGWLYVIFGFPMVLMGVQINLQYSVSEWFSNSFRWGFIDFFFAGFPVGMGFHSMGFRFYGFESDRLSVCVCVFSWCFPMGLKGF